jgi:hypothetical protein
VNVRRWVLVASVVLACWMGGYALLTREPDVTAYRQLCVEAAQKALDGAGTARLVTGEPLLSPYQDTMMSSAQELIGEARAGLAGITPPDERSTQRRDVLIPLIDDTALAYEDLAEGLADDDQTAAEQAKARLAEIEEQLRIFIDGNRG